MLSVKMASYFNIMSYSTSTEQSNKMRGQDRSPISIKMSQQSIEMMFWREKHQ